MGVFDRINKALGRNDPAFEQAEEWLNESYENHDEKIDGFQRRQGSPPEDEHIDVVLSEPMNLYVMGALIEEEGVGSLVPGKSPMENTDRLEVEVIGEPGDEQSVSTIEVEEYEGGRLHKHAMSNGQFHAQNVYLGHEDALLEGDEFANPVFDRIQHLGRYFEVEDQLPDMTPDLPPEAVDKGEEYAREISVDGEEMYEVGVRVFGEGSGYLTERVPTEDKSEYQIKDEVREAKKGLRKDKVWQARQYLTEEGIIGG